ncbi:tetratricopeptide repeat protein [Dyadobacter sp. CY261]|uniref:type IX secretion system periplasmic lipoprotein PorW/SprE n=1 Tax=Dyadobacter sp. CY261 TaxID=2907203 RepID=UPI001F3016F1|nr:tetratricopeptide repeat protein [Dyadobacter sp. CY261]MCF0073177.1 tetratricopeptide repeat protein [Dyadobacter sp. CY261]
MIDRFTSQIRRTLPLLALMVILAACSQYSSRPGAITFHNVAARYNAYFMAEQNMLDAEFEMKKAYKENYNQLLPILLPMDSVLAQAQKAKLQDVIKKASIVAEKHQNSKWIDNSYILLGKSRLYLGEWADGLEALRYVYANGHDETDKNNALIVLMRAYIEHKDYSNALGVAEYLSQQPLSKGSQRDFYLTKAYLHQQNGEYLTAAAILEETFPLLKKSTETARLHFSAAQMYDRLGQYALANKHYKSVNKNKPNYDLGFYSAMNSLQNEVVLNPQRDLSNVGFEKMLRDRKNDDLKDRVYFTMGLLAEHKKQIPEAVSYLQKAAAASKGNMQQKAYTYLQLARIEYESRENFESSKAYYDSALAILPREAPEYRLVADRKRALDNFVTQYTIVSAEDSLQRLAKMNPAALDNKIDAIIEAQEKKRLEEEENARKAQILAQNANMQQGGGNPLVNGAERRWELYDPALVNKGKIDFKRAWGNRPLEDDWRRSSRPLRSLAGNNAGATDSTSVAQVPTENTGLKKGTAEWDQIHALLKKNVPLADTAFAASQKKKEDALYNLGKIYRFDLKESNRAIVSFERVLSEYPNTQYKDEIYYLLFLSNEDNTAKKEAWKSRLLGEYPNSTYARLVNKSTDTGGTSGNATKEYEGMYKLYAEGNYTKALEDIEKNLPSYKGSSMEDKFSLLRVFLIGKVRGKEAYAQAITEFMRLYPTSIYLPRLKEMQEFNSVSMGNR